MAADVSDVETVLSSRDYSRLAPTIFNRTQIAPLRVMVVGAGALGNEAIKNLALLGVGELYIVDRDVIEASNLTRSVLFCVSDIGEILPQRIPKAEFIAGRVGEINPDVHVVPIVREVADVGLGLLARMDLVFGCLDNELARLELSWACQRVDTPLVDAGLGSTNYSSGLVSVFPGSEGPCYACRKGRKKRSEILQELQGIEDPCWLRERRLLDQGITPTTPLMSSIIAGIQVEAGLRHVLGSSSQASTKGRSIRLSLFPDAITETFSFRISPNCPLHDSTIHNLISLDGRRSCDLTVAELIVAAAGKDGLDDGVLSLDWPIITDAVCSSCDHVWRPMWRKARFARSGRCPACNSAKLKEVDVVTSIDVSSPLATKALRELGLPELHVYEVSWGGSKENRRYVETSGDWLEQES